MRSAPERYSPFSDMTFLHRDRDHCMLAFMFSTPTKCSVYAILAVLVPLLCTVLGIALAFVRPQSGDFVTVLVWSGFAAASGVFCAVRSTWLREPWRALAIVGAVLSLVPIGLVITALANFRFMF